LGELEWLETYGYLKKNKRSLFFNVKKERNLKGMLVYSLDQNLVFDPYDLEIEITPVNIKKTLDNKEYSTALILSFRLNENKLIQEVLESIPYSDSKWCL
jgi:hypothetical protein